MNDTLFNADEWLRYSRHIQLPHFGALGQTALKKSHVVIIGMGGLGAPVSLYLAAAGVGKITIYDGDTVDVTNLQRQVIFTQDDVGKPKALCAKARLNALNPHIQIDAHVEYFSEAHAENLGDDIRLVLDCTDNFSTRYLINDVCVAKKIPWVYASIHQYSGQAALFLPGKACFRCLFPEAPSNAEDCNAAGVIGVLPGMLGLFQANEAVKYLAGLPASLENQLLLFDALTLKSQKISLAIDPQCFCQTCVHSQSQSQSEVSQNECLADEHTDFGFTPEKFNFIRNNQDVEVIDVRTVQERAGFHIGGTHIPLADLHQFIIDNTKQYLCYCQSGKRSEEAVKHFRQSGLIAHHLQGGLLAWLKAAQK